MHDELGGGVSRSVVNRVIYNKNSAQGEGAKVEEKKNAKKEKCS